MTRLGTTVDGAVTHVEVWAPSAVTVEIGLETAAPPGGDAADALRTTTTFTPDRVMALTRSDDDPPHDTWSITIESAAHGTPYCLRVDDGPWLPDPASRWQPWGVHGPSAVVDEARRVWTDASWRGIELADAIIYELHVGTFTAAGTFDAAIGELARLVDLGVTAIELMPVAAFPGERNWGYDGVLVFAAQESYGGPEGLARLVDAAHGAGLAVLLDVVYNHIGPEGNVLGRFGPYFTDAYSTPWGDAINVADRGSDGVRRYFIENAVGWIRDFHLDGLRLDAVHAIVDPTAVPFVEELTAEVHAAAHEEGRSVLVTVESSANDPRIVRPRSDHGWGCDAVWNDDVHHALRVALTGDSHEYYAAYSGVADLAKAWRDRLVFDGQYSSNFGRRHGAPAADLDPRRFIVFSTNHDHVGNTPAGARLLADAAPGDPRHRLAAAAVLLSPFTPMLFMGEEYGEPAPFPYFVDHGDPGLLDAVREGRRREFSGSDWSATVADPGDPATFAAARLDPALGEAEPHSLRLAMYRELCTLRRTNAVLTDPTAVQVVDLDVDLLTVRRSLGPATAVLRLHFGPGAVALEPADSASSLGAIAFDSDDVRWGGPGHAADRLGPWTARLEMVDTP